MLDRAAPPVSSAIEEIDITPSMIDAGVLALYGNDEMFCSSEERVAAIFRAMFARRMEAGDS
jgi:hypothetical protein